MRHIVRQGECLSSIASAYGFADWRTVYNDSANAGLRQKRPNANVLFPGDEITIPDRDLAPVEAATKKRHRFVLKLPRRKLKISMLDEFRLPMKDEPYYADADGVLSYGVTDGDGVVALDLPVDTARVEIWIRGHERTFELGALNPMDETPDDGVSGVQGRLHGLGFEPGAIDGKFGPRTRAAVVAFQRHFGLELTGEIDDTLKKRLKKEYGT